MLITILLVLLIIIIIIVVVSPILHVKLAFVFFLADFSPQAERNRIVRASTVSYPSVITILILLVRMWGSCTRWLCWLLKRA